MRRVRLKSVKGQRNFVKSVRRRVRLLNLQRACHRIKLSVAPRRSTRLKSGSSCCIPPRILEGIESGLEVTTFPNKGRGIIATQPFQKGEPLLEYVGELISKSEGMQREHLDSEHGSYYLFYFHHRGRDYCLDATSEEIKRKGRLVNHSFLNPNAIMKKMEQPDGVVRLILYALRSIQPQEEILYDYGERRSAVIAQNPWLKTT